MKKILVGIFALAAFTINANAQETRASAHHKAFHRKAMMFKDLNLSAAQKEQLKADRKNTKMQLLELNKNENITVKEFREKKAAILKTQKDEMDKVLTPEQKQQLAQNKMKLKARHDQFSAKKLEKMKAKLNLSDDQVAKIKADREASMEKVKAIRENSQLSPAEKKEQLMAVRQAQKNNFRQVLTPEQISKMEELKKERMDRKSSK